MTLNKTYRKMLAISSLAVVAAVSMPALSQARTHYTGKTPPVIAMMATPFEPMEPAVSKHSKTVSKKHSVIKTSAKKSKKHKKLLKAATHHKAKAATKKKA